MATPVFKFIKRVLGLRPKVGLVLGGGVARGLSHIGVLKVLHKNNVPIDYIAATSSGSLMGALYAGGMSPYQMERVSKYTGWNRVLHLSFSKHAAFGLEGLRRFVIKRIGDKSFSEMKIPIRIIATDIREGASVVLKEGSVPRAVCASATFPGLFAPVEIEGRLLVDGGIFNNLPVDEVKKMGAEIVIAVDPTPYQRLEKFPEDIVHLLGRSIDLMLHGLCENNRKKADILIEPHIDEDISHLDLRFAERLIRAGEEAAQKALPKIEELISSLPPKE